MSTYLRLTAMVVVFMFLGQANAQDNVLCDTSWWQQLKEEDATMLNRDLNKNNLYNRCNDDGDTPLMIAYMAGASDAMIANILKIVAINAIGDFVSVTNAHEKSFLTMLLQDYEEKALFYFNVDINFNIHTIHTLPAGEEYPKN